METTTAVLIGVGVVAVVGIGAVIISQQNAANEQAILAARGAWTNPNTGQLMNNDAAMLFAGLSGGSQVLSSIFSGIANINRSNQQSASNRNPAAVPMQGPGYPMGTNFIAPTNNPFDYMSRS